MKRISTLLLGILLLALSFGTAEAVDRTGYDELTQIMDSAKIMEVAIFAPKTWEKAVRKFGDAAKNIELSKSQKTVDRDVEEASEYAENAIKASEVCKLSLQEYIEPRDKAQTAMAPRLVPELYMLAEEQFMKATKKVESGDVKGALKEATKSTPLFDTAELEAIRADVLGTADKLIEKARADEAEKYALSTLDKATTARRKGDAIITADRYNREDAAVEATRAEYEARHASNIAQSVRSLNRNDQAWEKLMLTYEIEMNRVGTAIGLEFLPFDDGPLAAADTLVTYVNAMQADNSRLTEQMKDLSGNMTGELQATLQRFEISMPEADPLLLAHTIDSQVIGLMHENLVLAEQVAAGEATLTQLRVEHEETSDALAARMEKEEKFRKAKSMFNPSEGQVLFNAANDIVLRFSGLSFDVGKSEIQDEHIPLLEKIKETVQMFPEAEVRVEGHTDASGEASRNVTLSEKRALAVMQYLRESLLIPANQISSIGYGADRPIASNQSADGRAKNRRIDIVIMQ